MDPATNDQTTRVTLYGNQSVIARVTEGRSSTGLFVDIDGLAGMSGRRRFDHAEDAEVFLARLDRSLTAAGFERLWRTGRSDEGDSGAREDQLATRVVAGLRKLWSGRLRKEDAVS
jgi:hypothetical protein